MKIKALAVSALVAGSAAPFAAAQHAGDVLLDVSPMTGRIRTNALVPGGMVMQNTRVFTGTFGTVGGAVFTDDPGFDSAPGTFAASSAIGFTILGSLREWNGRDLDTIPGERIAVSFGPLGPVTTPTAEVPVNGFTIAVGSNGQWHRHLEYELTPPAGSGVYVMRMRLQSTSSTVMPSQPFWLVFGHNAPPEPVNAAARFVEENLICRADVNADEMVNSQDFFDFVAAFFGGDADFNQDGMTNSQDFFDFLTEFFAGC